MENPMAPATKKQTWSLFTLTGKDYRSNGLTMGEASKLIIEAKKAKDEERVNKEANFIAIWNEAVEAAEKAMKECKPIPMVVQQHSNQLDDASPVEKEYFVEGGVCGFAWVIVKPGTSSFAKWLKRNGHGKTSSYYGGIGIWPKGGGQSLQRKEAYTQALASVLRKHGIDAYSMSRLD